MRRIVSCLVLASACSSGEAPMGRADAEIICATSDDCGAGLGCVGGVCVPDAADGGGLGEPEIEVSPLELDFGSPLLGVDVVLYVTVRNRGDGTLHLLDAHILEDDLAPELSLDADPPAAVQPDEEVTIGVAVRPADGETDRGWLVIASDDLDEPAV